jgi:uncharacterized protein (TIGR00304 family)
VAAQFSELLQYASIGIIIVGVVMLIVALYQIFSRPSTEQPSEGRSKGIVLLGPIPIVWGFGRSTQVVIGFVAVFIVIIWLLLYIL